MSIVDGDGAKVVLPRGEPDGFWAAVRGHYAGDDPARWRRLAIFALREQAGWPADRIAAAFETDDARVGRVVRNVRRELRDRFRPEPPRGHREVSGTEPEG